MWKAFIDTAKLFPKVIVPIYIPSNMNVSIGMLHKLVILDIFFILAILVDA